MVFRRSASRQPDNLLVARVALLVVVPCGARPQVPDVVRVKAFGEVCRLGPVEPLAVFSGTGCEALAQIVSH